tara:strand:+ start:440 stop:724 length:285 start_codon:yes stop_codon:yes gene_type:complete
MNLKQLAQAASDYYGVAYTELVSPCRQVECTRPRHICQWIAKDAGYKQSTIARFWKLDGSAVHYGCKVVQRRLDTSDAAVADIKKFMAYAKQWD